MDESRWEAPCQDLRLPGNIIAAASIRSPLPSRHSGSRRIGPPRSRPLSAAANGSLGFGFSIVLLCATSAALSASPFHLALVPPPLPRSSPARPPSILSAPFLSFFFLFLF